MPDIFLSYNRDDQARGKVFAEAFTAQGFDVWWDAALRSGETYDQVTEKALRNAKAVVVLWSRKSVDSNWVRAEASIGQEHNRLAPVKIEACDLPVMFRLVQTAELTHWKGDARDAAWGAFLSDVRKLVERDAPGAAQQSRPASPAPSSPRQLLRRPLGLGGIALAAIILVVGGLLVMQKSQGPLTVQRTAFFGLTTTSSDPVVKAMAEAATDETFQGMSAMRVDTVAGAELGTPAERRLARASELGAQYALSGNVGSNDSGINIAIRLEEVPSRTTLWAGGVEGEASQTKSLPVEAAAKAIDLLTCFKRRLRTLPRNDPELLPLVAQVCSQVRLIDLKTIAPAEELAQKVPMSANARPIWRRQYPWRSRLCPPPGKRS